MKKRVLILTVVCFFLFIIVGCSKEGETKPEEETNQEDNSGETEGEIETCENEYQGNGFSIDMGERWKYAYNDQSYIYYYMISEDEVQDSNVILNITTDDSLKEIDPEKLAEALKETYKDKDIVTRIDKINGYNILIVEMEENDGDMIANVGQYIVLGKDKGIVFSLYAENSKFAMAKEHVETALGSIKMR